MYVWAAGVDVEIYQGLYFRTVASNRRAVRKLVLLRYCDMPAAVNFLRCDPPKIDYYSIWRFEFLR